MVLLIPNIFLLIEIIGSIGIFILSLLLQISKHLCPLNFTTRSLRFTTRSYFNVLTWKAHMSLFHLLYFEDCISTIVSLNNSMSFYFVHFKIGDKSKCLFFFLRRGPKVLTECRRGEVHGKNISNLQVKRDALMSSQKNAWAAEGHHPAPRSPECQTSILFPRLCLLT